MTMKKRIFICLLFFLAELSAFFFINCGPSNDNNEKDSMPPNEVIGLIAKQQDGKITLTWIDPQDSDLDHIEVGYTPGDAGITMVDRGARTYTVTGLSNNTTYTFTVKSVDQEGKRSSGCMVNATPTVPDHNAPGEVKNFMSVVGDGNITLRWDNPDDADLAKVIIYINNVSSIEIQKDKATHTLKNLNNWIEYCITLKTVDYSGNISAGTALKAMPSNDPGMIDNDNPLIVNNADGTYAFTGESNFQNMLRLLPPSFQAKLDAAWYIPGDGTYKNFAVQIGSAALSHSIDFVVSATFKNPPALSDSYDVYCFTTDRYDENSGIREWGEIDIALFKNDEDAENAYHAICENKVGGGLSEINTAGKLMYGGFYDGVGSLCTAYYLVDRVIYYVYLNKRKGQSSTSYRSYLQDMLSRLGVTFKLNAATDIVQALGHYTPAVCDAPYGAGVLFSYKKNNVSVPGIEYTYRPVMEGDPGRLKGITNTVYFYPDRRSSDDRFHAEVLSNNDILGHYDLLDHIDGREVLCSSDDGGMGYPYYRISGSNGTVFISSSMSYSAGTATNWHGILPQSAEEFEADIDRRAIAKVREMTLESFNTMNSYYVAKKTTDEGINLQSISLSAGELFPVFDPAVTEYRVIVEGTADPFRCSASAADPGHIVSIDGKSAGPGEEVEIPLAPGKNFIDIKVSSDDDPGQYKTYHVRVWKYNKKTHPGDYKISNGTQSKNFYSGGYSGISGSLYYNYAVTQNSTHSDHTLCYLYGLIDIEGSLVINGSSANTILTCVYGLEWLDRIGNLLTIKDNDVLINLNGMSTIKTIGGLILSNNKTLTSIDTLGTMRNTSLSTLVLDDNPLLENVEPLNLITHITGDLIIGRQYAKNNLGGLRKITAVDGKLELTSQHEPNFGGFRSIFPSIKSVGGLLKHSYYNVMVPVLDLSDVDINGLWIGCNAGDPTDKGPEKIDGFQNVTSLPGGLYLDRNLRLADISSMRNIASVGKTLHIYGCEKLADIPFIGNINTMSGWIYIVDTAVSDLNFTNLTEIQKCDPDPEMNPIGCSRLSIYQNACLKTISCEKLVSVKDNVSISENPSLESIKMGKLSTVTSSIFIENNNSLTTLEIGNLTSTANLIIRNNPLLPKAVVDAIQARIDSGQLVVTETVDLSGNGK